MKKKTALRKAKKLEIGIKQHQAYVANRKGTLDEHVDGINERYKIAEGDGISPAPKRKGREDFSQVAARIVKEATEGR